MTLKEPLHRPWLVAVWPVMGNVALSAGYYLMAKLDMQILAEVPSQDLFELQHIRLTEEEEQMIERLFREAEEDRTNAYELKRELDRLDLFRDYEDRFLDLFKQSDSQ